MLNTTFGESRIDRQLPSEYSGADSIGMMRLAASGWVGSIWPLAHDRSAGTPGPAASRMPLGVPLCSAESRAPTRPLEHPGRLAHLAVRQGRQDHRQRDGADDRMMRITTSSSISVNPRREPAPRAARASGDGRLPAPLTTDH